MKSNTRTLLSLLGVAHALVVIALLPTLFFFGYFSLFAVIPGLIWLIVLGFRLWRPYGALRRAMRVTHLILAPLAVLLIVYGIYCLRAARRSAEGGGGLLGLVGLIPIVMGVLTLILSMVSLYAIKAGLFEQIGD